jgi:hypothetical protein
VNFVKKILDKYVGVDIEPRSSLYFRYKKNKYRILGKGPDYLVYAQEINGRISSRSDTINVSASFSIVDVELAKRSSISRAREVVYHIADR